jgi:hypothetical protein
MAAEQEREMPTASLEAASASSHQAAAYRSVERALVAGAAPGAAGAWVRVRDGVVALTWYVAPGLSRPERDGLTRAGTAVLDDLPAGFAVEQSFVEVAQRGR